MMSRLSVWHKEMSKDIWIKRAKIIEQYEELMKEKEAVDRIYYGFYPNKIGERIIEMRFHLVDNPLEEVFTNKEEQIEND